LESKTTYRQILKATSVFGGVQVFGMIVSVIRSKLIAVFIGPAGMGIAALLTATTNIISGISSLGIEVSAVKHISGHYRDEDHDSVSVPVSIVRRIALYTGIVGTLMTALLSSWLSVMTFGDYSHTFSFAFLAVTLLLKQLSTAELAILQSLRKIKYLARANFFGNLIGLLFSAPLYYFYGIDAIVPTIIIATACATLSSYLYSYKVKIKRTQLNRGQFLEQGKSILKLGILMTLANVLTLVVSWLIQIYIGHSAGTETVGFYNAGFTMLNSYVGILFVAMGTDYFPRLSALIDNHDKMKEAVLEQSIIGVLIITPIIALFLAFSDEIVRILFASEFAVIVPMVSIGIVGMLFRTVSFSIGYMILAKADTKLFITNAVGFNLLYLILGILGYYYFGLEGLGLAFALHYICHFAILAVLSHYKYNFNLDREFVVTFAVCVVFSALAFGLYFFAEGCVVFMLQIGIALLSLGFSLYRINRKTDLVSVINRIKNK